MEHSLVDDILKGFDSTKSAAKSALPPVHLWNPDFCGDIDMRIARDGTWYYLGTPIGRKRLARLFSTVLRHDDDGRYYLVTPAEKIGITVDDAPFVAVGLSVEGEGETQTLRFTTNMGDAVEAGLDNPIRVTINGESGEPSPYVLVRARLEALIGRSVFYDLVALGCGAVVEGQSYFGVWSGGMFFPFMGTDELHTLSDTECS
ncbi:MAG: DUF1285 domain-containing protein [Parvularculales bacterium]